MIYIEGTDSARMTNIWNDKLQKVNSVVMHDRCKMRFEISHIGSKRKCDPVGVAGGHQLRHHRRRIHTSLGLTNLDHREAGPYESDTRDERSSGTDHLLRSKPTVRWSSTKDEFTGDIGETYKMLVTKENHMTYT